MGKQKKSTKARQLNKIKKHNPKKKITYDPSTMMFSDGVSTIMLRDLVESECNQLMKEIYNEQH